MLPELFQHGALFAPVAVPLPCFTSNGEALMRSVDQFSGAVRQGATVAVFSSAPRGLRVELLQFNQREGCLSHRLETLFKTLRRAMKFQ